MLKKCVLLLIPLLFILGIDQTGYSASEITTETFFIAAADPGIMV